MAPERESLAAPAPPRRFVAVYQPGGTILERWTPVGSEQTFALGPILAPFEPLKQQLLVLSGVDVKSAATGWGIHAHGMVAWLTGTAQQGESSAYKVGGPSVDQVIARRISAGRALGNDPASGLKSSYEDRTAVDPETDAAIPAVGKFMMDMLVMALACDLTAVGTMQWSDAEAKYTLPWLGLIGTHHCYMNDCGFNPDECAQIATWYSEQHAYLLRRMMEVDMGGHSLLDETVVFIGSDIQDPSSYNVTDMPFLLAGGGGALRTGRWVTYDHVSHNDLLLSLSRLYGGTEMSFGNPEYSSGPLPNL